MLCVLNGGILPVVAGDYLFAVKGNQGRLNKAFEEKFPLKELNNPEHDSYAMSEKSHGREEIRLHIVCDVPDELIDFTFEWKGLKKLCVAVSFRSIIAEQKKEPEMTVRYYISSADLTAEKFATAIRNHWHGLPAWHTVAAGGGRAGRCGSGLYGAVYLLSP